MMDDRSVRPKFFQANPGPLRGKHPEHHLDTPFFITLQSGRGFAFNLSPSSKDDECEAICRDVFGDCEVDRALGLWKRADLSYDDLLTDFFQYRRRHRPRRVSNDPIYQMCLESLKQQFSRTVPIIPLTTGGVIHHKDFPGAKSPGIPFKWHGYRTKREVVEDEGALKGIYSLWYAVGRGTHVALPDVAMFARSQICCPEDNKIRMTWGYPVSVYLEEGRFFYPLLEWLKSDTHTIPLAYGFEMANGGMRAIHSMLGRHSKGVYVMTDWSKFDKSIPPWLIQDCFKILLSCFDLAHVRASDGAIFPVDPKKTLLRWNKMTKYFINTPVRTCKGDRFLVKGGIPSGSCFTNIIDSMINILVTRYLCYKHCGVFPSGELYLGDDAVFCVNGVVNLADWAETADSVFGMTLSLKKSKVTRRINNVEFLGYTNGEGFPIRDNGMLIASFIQPEHARKERVEAAASALGQLWTCFDERIAFLWYRVVQYFANKYCGGQLEEVHRYLAQHHFRFKFIMTAGWTVESLSIPCPNPRRLICEVNPPPGPRKIIRYVTWDYSKLWQDARQQLSHPSSDEREAQCSPDDAA